MHVIFSEGKLLPFHVFSICSSWKCMYYFSFPIFYLNSTCSLMHMVFSESELLPSHVLSSCCCWKCMYFFAFPMFYPNSTCRPIMLMTFSASELLPSHVISACCCWKWMYFVSFPINRLPKFHLLSYEHGILSWWVVAFPCIKYM